MQDIFEFDSFRVDVKKRQFWRDGEQIQLEPKAFDLLTVLLRRRGETLSKNTLVEEVWKETAVTDDSITQQISRLRKLLSDNPKNGRYIVTIPGIGYKFVGEAREVERINERELQAFAFTGNGIPMIEKSALFGSQTDLPASPARRKSISDEDVSFPAEFQPAARRYSEKLNDWRSVGLFVLLLAVVAGATIYYRRDEPKNALNVRSIAILPFVNFSAQPGAADLELEMADTLITKLGNLPQINVVPTAAVIKFDQKDRDISAIAQQLRVDAVLDGNYKQEGDKIRVNVQLVDARQGKVLWSDSFVEAADDAIFIQDDIALQIALRL